jgi:hypothetical protein
VARPKSNPELQSARLRLAYLPKGAVQVYSKDNPQNPIGFYSPESRDKWLKTFYCNDSKLLEQVQSEAIALKLVERGPIFERKEKMKHVNQHKKKTRSSQLVC